MIRVSYNIQTVFAQFIYSSNRRDWASPVLASIDKLDYLESIENRPVWRSSSLRERSQSGGGGSRTRVRS